MADDEQELFMDDVGSGPAVVLLHGTPSLHAAMARRRVLVPHLPGYGKTPPDAAPCSLDRMIARLEDKIGRVSVSDAAIVGFSGGAYKAVAMAFGGRGECPSPRVTLACHRPRGNGEHGPCAAEEARCPRADASLVPTTAIVGRDGSSSSRSPQGSFARVPAGLVLRHGKGGFERG
jgi:hypothetical protein